MDTMMQAIGWQKQMTDTNDYFYNTLWSGYELTQFKSFP
jgi:hypothetical protein